jgi:hypothetical protein
MRQVLKYDETGLVYGQVLAVIGGAILSVILPVKGMVGTVCLIVAWDVYLSFRLKAKTRRGVKKTTIRQGLWRMADHMASLIVVNAFQDRYFPAMPLTYVVGVGLAYVELSAINKKITMLHNFDLMAEIGHRIRPGTQTSNRGDRSGNSGGGEPS